MKIAVEGCAHGDLENIYSALQHLERVQNTKIDLLICCGDFQAIRNENDMECLSCPAKYRELGSFWKYYSGVEKAPYPTVFVGGNHEASNYLWELYYGGWTAPNIYFLGFAGVIRFGGLRIGGLSGIYKSNDYRSGHFERPPYDTSQIRSVYHIREYEVRKLLQIKDPVDIFISHDWPCGITEYGNKERLLSHKPHFREEVEQKNLGSRPAMEILRTLKPSYWFSAHLHTKFAAVFPHEDGSVTKFLALDKCLPRRDFLQIIEVSGADGPGLLEFRLDEEWLAITRAYHPFLPLTRSPFNCGKDLSLELHRQWVGKLLAEEKKAVPPSFAMTANPHNPGERNQEHVAPDAGHAAYLTGAGVWKCLPAVYHSRAARPAGVLNSHIRNPQTEALLTALELKYNFGFPGDGGYGSVNQESICTDPDEIQLEEDVDEDAPPDDNGGG